MAEAPKLDTSRYTGPKAQINIEVPEITVTPDGAEPAQLENRYSKPGSWQSENAIPGTGITLGSPWKTAAERGIKGLPGMPMDIVNFIGNIPKMSMDVGGGLVNKAYNIFADEPYNAPQTASESIGMPEVNLPGGHEDFQRWLGAPKLDPAATPTGRIGQAALETGLESIGPGMLGSALKKGIPRLVENPNFFRELIAPSKAPVGKQIVLDSSAGAGVGAGLQYGEENDDPAAGVVAAGLGALTPVGIAGGRRGLAKVFGAREPVKFSEHPAQWLMDLIAPPGGSAEAKARLAETFDKLHPNARLQLANEIAAANARATERLPGGNVTTGMLTDNPAIDYLLSGAKQRSNSMLRQSAVNARDDLRQVWDNSNPNGNPNDATANIWKRVEATVANIANKRKAAEAAAATAEDATKVPASQIGAATADAEKAALAEDLHAGISSELANARETAGAAIEDVKNSGFTIPGKELEDWRTAIVNQADKQGQKSFLPAFLNPKNGGLNEELYPTSLNGVADAPGALPNVPPKSKDIAQVIGWDQVLRDQETSARLAGNSAEAHWAAQARQELNTRLEKMLGSDQYTAAKKAYLEDVVKRFYTPTVDPVLSAKHIPATTGAKLIPTGPKGAQAARDVLAAVGDDPAAGKAFVDYTLADFAGYAYNTRSGKLDVAKANSWLKTHAPLIAELRNQSANASPTASTLASTVVDKIDDVMHNQTALDEALNLALDKAKKAGARETTWTASLQNKSAARFVLGKDPEAAAKQIVNSPNLTEDAKALSLLVGKDPAAKVGLQQAIYDHLTNEMSGLTAKVDASNIKGITAQIQQQLLPYQKLEKAGVLPKGFTKRARLALATEYSINRVNRSVSGGNNLVGGAQMAQNDVSQFGRGLFGSRSGNLIAGTARDLFGQPGSDLLHKILRDAALNPAKMVELLRAEKIGKVNLKSVLLRQAAEHGYKDNEDGQ